MKKYILNPKMAALWMILQTSLLVNNGIQAYNMDSTQKQSIALVDFDTRGYDFRQSQAVQFVINELIRLGQYEVMDKYEVEYVAKRDSLNAIGCFSKICLSDFGKHLGIEKMFSGSIQLLGDKVNITLRLLDVKTKTFEKTIVKEFLNIPGNELMMIRVSFNEMYGLKNEEDVMKKLTVKAEYDNTVNNPYQLKLRADGPRMGIVGFSGVSASVIQNPINKGGYNSYPFMFQFGYQYEKQYLNEGNFQALVEMIPMISGMDQGRIIPSFSFLNGLRNNRTGWEFAFGPTFNITKLASGFYFDEDNDGEREWHLENDRQFLQLRNEVLTIEKRPDSRGHYAATAGFLFAFGKTFKSGRMNIPLNMFIIPGKNGCRFGLSFGWNGRERYELNN
jgi:hypothetical protein